MATTPDNNAVRRDSFDSKTDKIGEECLETTGLENYLDRFPLIKDKTPEELQKIEKSLVRKLDWKFLPCITLMLLMKYVKTQVLVSTCQMDRFTNTFISYLDRINVSNARLAGMQSDLGMTDTQWSAGISMFYVGYIISQVPGNVILAKGNPRILLPCFMLAWSTVTICMTAMTTPWSFILCRFLVGVAEGPFVPGVSLMTSSWYTKQESPLRMSIWHAGNIISNVISGLLSAAVLTNMDNVAGLTAWQVTYSLLSHDPYWKLTYQFFSGSFCWKASSA